MGKSVWQGPGGIAPCVAQMKNLELDEFLHTCAGCFATGSARTVLSISPQDASPKKKNKNQTPQQIPKPKCLPPKIANAQLVVMTARAVANAAPPLIAVAIPVNAVS